jgi:hypothetical protein
VKSGLDFWDFDEVIIEKVYFWTFRWTM